MTSERRRRGGDPVSVGDVIAQSARTIGLSTGLAAIISDAGVWADVVGEDLAGSGRPVRVDEGTLVVAASDLIGETRLRYAAEVIRDAVNKHLGSEQVRSVAIRRHNARER